MQKQGHPGGFFCFFFQRMREGRGISPHQQISKMHFLQIGSLSYLFANFSHLLLVLYPFHTKTSGEVLMTRKIVLANILPEN